MRLHRLINRPLKAGILLYALFMAAVFVLLLQFYLARVSASSLVQAAQYQQAQASLMAELTKELADKDKDTYQFNQGSASYNHHQNTLVVTVTLSTGKTYRYQFITSGRANHSSSLKQESSQGSLTSNSSDQSVTLSPH